MAPPYTGEVNITVIDGGAAIVSVPAASVQAVIGCAGSGTANAVVATRSPSTLRSTFSNGPLLQAAGMALQSTLTNGGGVGPTVLAVRAATTTAGYILGSSLSPLTVAGTSSGTGGKVEIETSAAHGLSTGWTVTISGVGGTTEANGTWVVTVVDSTHFLINVAFANAWTSGGSVQPLGTVAGTITSGVYTPGLPSGTSVITFTGTATDRYFIVIKVLVAGTIGSAGIVLQVSYDAGRNFGPQIALGTATTLALSDSNLDTGITANFAAGTLSVNDFARCSTIAPAPNVAGVQAAIAALAAYANISATQWGSMHIAAILTGSDATSIETTLDNLATNNFIYTRTICETRDASPPAAWGGSGESGATWSAAILSDFAAVTARRVSPSAGYYNMPSAYPTYLAGTPSYRQSLGYAYAARECVIPPQRHAGRVRDGSLSQIVVNPNVDPSDGFVYWDSASSPTLDYFLPGGAGRFTTARTRQSLSGYFISNPLTLAPVGSDFTLFPRGEVMDVACAIAHSTLEQFVNADLQTRPNGTLMDKDADTVRMAVSDALTANMVSVGMISNFVVAVDQTNNIQVTSTLIVTITILGVGYVLQETVTISYATALAA